ncbi:MAG: 6-carboxytetrahydropterin synthase [Deltaproteobacteria bacterium]|nr:6-carboxytetrahydropterin synthase [Deltaproteobacteria bacterium]
MPPRMQVEVDFRFSAAHALPLYEGPCQRMHGHNYKLRVISTATLNPKTGIALDFGDVQKVVQREIMPQCDHRVLNDFMENPTAENVILWMWEKLKGPLPGLLELRLWEQDEFCMVYRGE